MDERRLDVAKDLGADCILKVTSNDPVKIAREIEAIMGEQPDVTIECAGADVSTQTAVYVSNLYVSTQTTVYVSNIYVSTQTTVYVSNIYVSTQTTVYVSNIYVSTQTTVYVSNICGINLQ